MRQSMPLLLRADARQLPLPDDSVDLIVTSPPYFGLRSYIDGGEHYDGQIGSEATPTEFLDELIACTREWMRVLKPSGSLWVDLGDKYVNDLGLKAGHGQGINGRLDRGVPLAGPVGAVKRYGMPRKSLMLLPERYRIRCVDELGLIARAVVVWAKPNGLPESVTDRVRRSHEDWVHLTKRLRYYSAVDEIREPHTMRPQRRPSGRPEDVTPRGGQPRQTWSTATREEVGVDGHSLGKLPGSVWEIATQPLKVPAELGVDHFAAFPMEWPRRIILGWSPRDVCTGCGEGQRPVVERPGLLGEDNNPFSRDGSRTRSTLDGGSVEWRQRMANPDRITGYACACSDTSAPSTPGVVLDPFGGTGTTALVATMLGRRGISVDLSADYCRLAKWRCMDPKERARAAGLDPDKVSAIKPVVAGQGDLFDLLGGGAV